MSADEVLKRWRSIISEDLYDNVVKFWLNHSIDRKYGGYFNCIGKHGKRFDDKKYVWLQGRQVWMLAKLYLTATDEALTTYKINRDALLDAAFLGAEFLMSHAVVREDRGEAAICGATTAVGTVFFSLARDGSPHFVQRKIFSGCFYVMGLLECSRALESRAESILSADGDESSAADLAGRAERMHKEGLTVFDRVIQWIKAGGTALGRPAFEGEEPLIPLNQPMILLNMFQEMRVRIPAEEWAEFYPDMRAWCITEICKHIDEERQVVFENVRADGSPSLDSPEGRLLNPGHAIEAGWFLLDYAHLEGRQDLVKLALKVMEWSFQRGWDKEHGGILYFLDVEGHSPVQLEWNMKLWWPHCEALIAFAYAFQVTKDTKWVALFDQVAKYTYSHFPDATPERGPGEWFGYLDREGRPTHDFKGGPYKGCFHVPRALWMVDRLLGDAGVEYAATSLS